MYVCVGVKIDDISKLSTIHELIQIVVNVALAWTLPMWINLNLISIISQCEQAL